AVHCSNVNVVTKELSEKVEDTGSQSVTKDISSPSAPDDIGSPSVTNDIASQNVTENICSQSVTENVICENSESQNHAFKNLKDYENS
ncbi:hypothetical protein U1Q18_052333, partial [Sarracenia purpurea var. burkii]